MFDLIELNGFKNYFDRGNLLGFLSKKHVRQRMKLFKRSHFVIVCNLVISLVNSGCGVEIVISFLADLINKIMKQSTNLYLKQSYFSQNTSCLVSWTLLFLPSIISIFAFYVDKYFSAVCFILYFSWELYCGTCRLMYI